MPEGDQLPENSIVVVDTTEFHGSRRLLSDVWARLLALSQDGRLHLFVPEVVLLEAERQLRKEFKREVDKLSDLIRTLGAMSDAAQEILQQAVADIEANVDVEAEASAIRERLEQHAVEILPLPGTSTRELLNRDLTSRRPFSETGKGFRDTLTWLSILECVKAPFVDEIVLITGNSGDFSQVKAKPTTPHQDLVADLAAFSHDIEISLYDSIKSFLASEHPSRLERALQMVGTHYTLSELEEPTLRQNLEQAVISWSDNNLPGMEIADVDDIRFEWAMQPGIPMEVTNLTIAAVNVESATLDVHQYDEYEGGAVLLRVEVEAELEMEGFMFKGDWYVLGDNARVDLLEADWSDHAVEVGTQARCKLVFDVLADEELAYIQDLSLSEIIPR